MIEVEIYLRFNLLSTSKSKTPLIELLVTLKTQTQIDCKITTNYVRHRPGVLRWEKRGDHGNNRNKISLRLAQTAHKVLGLSLRRQKFCDVAVVKL